MYLIRSIIRFIQYVVFSTVFTRIMQKEIMIQATNISHPETITKKINLKEIEKLGNIFIYFKTKI